ncbi:MFS transporter [Pusillimonas sp. CC-YST705]|uniref:MFS transporter n=1 Tax=Mesopusillimonas faecipullorum TaxID=2755040 RepID=A0ABS8CAQ3_9BURK|nr:MFS transporter [Mesopusillimonas faecipullorum]MCB5362709.1 MFS transporter [Mesopusillimonas faecipullorum]
MSVQGGQEGTTASWSELLWGRNGLRTLALAGGVALHAVNMFIVATILPSVVQDIGGLAYYSWNMTLFVMASILSSALSPHLQTAAGPRKAFLLAIVVFTVGTVLCAMAPDIAWMLVGRTLQGLGGGALLGLSYSSVRIVFPERLWPKTMALLSSMWGVATLLGPAIGGIFAEAGLWRWAFWSVILVAAGLAVVVQTQLKRQSALSRQAQGVPFVQLGLMVLAVLAVSVASLSPVAWKNLLGVVAGCILTLLIAFADLRGRTRLMPEGAYDLAKMGAVYACIALLSIVITSEVFVPYFLQVLHGHGPLAAGYLASLISIGWTIGTVSSAGQTGAVIPIVLRLGPAVTAVSIAALGLLLTVDFPGPGVSATVLALPLLGIGLGIGMCWPHMLTHIYKVAPAGQENMASSAIITVQLYAVAFGSALGGMIANAAGFSDPGGVEGAGRAAWVLLVSFGLPPALAAYYVLWVVKARAATARA